MSGFGKGDVLPILRIAAVLLAVCAICASLLAAVYVVTAPKIADNEESEVTAAIESIFPGFTSRTRTEYDSDKDVDYVMAVFGSDGAALGYAVQVSPTGFSDEIKMVIGVSVEFKIIKIEITSISETAGIGSRVNDASYLSGYSGLGSDVDFGKGINAVSGATRSSKAVLRGVKAALLACEAIYGTGGAITK